MRPEEQRAALTALAAERGESLAGLSRLLGRNAAYLQQYVERGSPRVLREEDRSKLARYLGVAEAALGGPAAPELLAVPRLDIAASAGPGRRVDREATLAPAMIDAGLLRRMGVRGGRLSLIEVEGDSMKPTLAHGDAILVDTSTRTVAPGAVHVVRVDDSVLVKRLERVGGALRIVSDNPAYPPVDVRAGDTVEVIGRVVWMARSL